MTREQVLDVFKTHIRAVTNNYIGSPVTKTVLDEMKPLIQEAAFEAYKQVPMAYRDMYEIPLPIVDQLTHSQGEVTIEWRTKNKWLYW